MTLREGKWRQPTDYLLHRSGGGIGNGCCQVGQQQQRGSGNNSEKKIGRKIYNQPGVFCAAEAATGSKHRQKRQQLTGCLLHCSYCCVVAVVADNWLIVCFASIFFNIFPFLAVTIWPCGPVADAAASVLQQKAS